MKQPDKKKKSPVPHRGQQLSDKLAQKVAQRKMTYEQASKVQKSQDSTYAAKHKQIKTGGDTARGATGNTVKTASKWKDAKYKVDKHGNTKAY